MTAFKWNWQQDNWPVFTYSQEDLKNTEFTFAQQSGLSLGSLKHVTKDEKNELLVEVLSNEALKTSEIEGEYLDRDSIQYSIQHNLGIVHTKKKVPPAESGVSQMMVHLYKTYEEPLSDATLFLWHEMLTNGRRDLTAIGCYRTHKDPMQVVSGRLDSPTVHYEAPPSSAIKKEMQRFIEWFNTVHSSANTKQFALSIAGIAHFYFLTLHPFEDGNGRIARALSEKSIAMSLGRPALLSLSQTINENKKEYYTRLELHNTKLDLTDWLLYFGQIILDAQKNTLKSIEYFIAKAKFFDRFAPTMNKRQTKAALRIFKEGYKGFKGGLSAENYMRIVKTSPSTATRDLADLVGKGIFLKKGALKSSRYYLNLDDVMS